MAFYFVQFLTGLASAASLFLVASGLSIIFGVTRIVNFAHGAFYMLGAYVAFTLTEQFSGAIGFWGGVVLAALIVAAIGVLVEMVLLRRIYHAPELFQLLATFGLTLMVEDLVVLIWGPSDLLGRRAPGFRGAVDFFGQNIPTYDLFLIALSPVVLGVLWLMFQRTRWGVLVRAATQDRDMVAALGVNQKWLFTSVFAVGVFLAALGGALQIPRDAVHHAMDLRIIVDVFVVVVIGGLGSIIGAFVAAVLVSELNAFGILIFPKISIILVFLVMAAVLIVRPWGLFGKQEAAARRTPGLTVNPWRPLTSNERLAAIAALVLAAALPLIGGNYALTVGSEIAIFVIFAASLHFLMSVGGLASFGHAAYFGLGAYGVAFLAKMAGLPMIVSLLLGPLLGLAGAAVFGFFAVQLSGVYFAMLTLAFAQIVWSVAFQWVTVTGGDNGILGVWPEKWAASAFAFLLAVDRRRRARGRSTSDHRVLAVRFRAARDPRFAAAQRGHRHRRQAHPVDRLRDRRHGRGHRRRAVRVPEGQRVSGQPRHLALGRCAGHGAARRRRDRVRRGGRRHRLQDAHHLAGEPDRSVQAGARRLHRADRGRLPQGHRRDAGDDPQSPPAGSSGAARFPDRDRRMSMAPTLLSVEALSKSYGGVHAVRGVSFSLKAGEILALIGPNGAGKSTCFDMLNGQNIPDSGRISLLGEDITGKKPRAIWRLGVGRTFQITATFPTMTVRENVQVALVSYGRQLFNLWASTPKFAQAEAGRLLELVGMGGYADRPCGELAYGDLKRLELAIALANQPKLLLMDEPTAGMAPRERIELMRLTAQIAREQSIGVLFTEHDMDVVFEHADRILVLNRGSLIAEGSPEAGPRAIRRSAPSISARAWSTTRGIARERRHEALRPGPQQPLRPGAHPVRYRARGRRGRGGGAARAQRRRQVHDLSLHRRAGRATHRPHRVRGQGCLGASRPMRSCAAGLVMCRKSGASSPI